MRNWFLFLSSIYPNNGRNMSISVRYEDNWILNIEYNELIVSTHMKIFVYENMCTYSLSLSSDKLPKKFDSFPRTHSERMRENERERKSGALNVSDGIWLWIIRLLLSSFHSFIQLCPKCATKIHVTFFHCFSSADTYLFKHWLVKPNKQTNQTMKVLKMQCCQFSCLSVWFSSIFSPIIGYFIDSTNRRSNTKGKQI